MAEHFLLPSPINQGLFLPTSSTSWAVVHYVFFSLSEHVKNLKVILICIDLTAVIVEGFSFSVSLCFQG